MKVWITQLRKGLLEFLTLNILEQGESYGYEIVQKLKISREWISQKAPCIRSWHA
jgi:DNA-binding PadR family transcriptional regulator